MGDSDSVRRRPPSPKPWLRVYWLLFAASAIAAIAFVASGNQVQSFGLTRSIYYIVLVPLGLACAAFLFGALRGSEARFDGNKTAGTLKLSGPVVVFVLVVAGGLRLAPPDVPPATRSLVVRVQGPGGPADRVTQGTVTIDTGQARRSGNIDASGEVHFEAIPTTAAKEIRVYFDGQPGYELKDASARKFPTEGVLYLELRRVRTEAFGVVRDVDGQPIPDVRIVVDYGAASGVTDPDGTFHIPCDMPNDRLVHVTATRNGRVGFSGSLSLPGPMNIQFLQ